MCQILPGKVFDLSACTYGNVGTNTCAVICPLKLPIISLHRNQLKWLPCEVKLKEGLATLSKTELR